MYPPFLVSPETATGALLGPVPVLITPDRSRGIRQQFVAMDCEMVGTGPRGCHSALARVSLVDYDGRCFFDTFVQVDEEVTDYRTHVSGISPQDLNSSRAITFDQCRKRVQTLIVNKVLVGHGLNNDLYVLRICHPWYNIRDTTMYQPYMKHDKFNRLVPSRLRDLALQHLGLKIQQQGNAHNPKEDAAAAMALYRKAQGEWDFAMDCKRRKSVL